MTLPLYVQITEQLKYLIRSAQLPPDSQLPTPVHLARSLRINKNTIVRAYQELSRDGFVVVHNGRGTFVADGVAERVELATDGHFMRQLDSAIERGLAVGLQPEQLASMVLMRAQALGARSAEVTAVLLECNSRSLDYFAEQLRRELGIAIVPVLLQQLDHADGYRAVASQMLKSDFVICTFYHLADVRKKLKQWKPLRALETFAIAVRPHLDVITRLKKLRPGSRLGVVYCKDEPFAESRLRAMTDMIHDIQLPNIEVTTVLFDPDAADTSVFDGCDALLVRTDAVDNVRPSIPAHVPIIEFAYLFDAAAYHMLKDVVDEFTARKSEQVDGGIPSPEMVVRSKRGSWSAKEVAI
jgi:DNA-binding transcriptional regulator YhcF (GntR family)